MLLLREYGRRPLKFGRLLGVSFAWLDRGHFGGMGWWDHANLLALRMHSHNIDQSAKQSRMRRGWWEYVGYLFYAPLYVAGPIMTSDDFSEQSRKEGGGSRKDDSVLVYAVRWICALFVMELLSARAPCFALASVGSRLLLGSSSSSAIDDPSAIGIGRLSASESLVFSYLRLQLVWLKFLIIWRFFTLWARFNGRSPPENLPAPSCSLFGFWNYSILGFWRSWHASFSRWLMIYLYVPLGGREHRYRNLLATFGFVALWHGVEGRMFGWAALVMLSIAPEVAASRFSIGTRVCGSDGTTGISSPLAARRRSVRSCSRTSLDLGAGRRRRRFGRSRSSARAGRRGCARRSWRGRSSLLACTSCLTWRRGVQRSRRRELISWSTFLRVLATTFDTRRDRARDATRFFADGSNALATRLVNVVICLQPASIRAHTAAH